MTKTTIASAPLRAGDAPTYAERPFVQIHLLRFIGLHNLNRDEAGQPKQANVGGVPRLRLSSQSQKRALRFSPAFQARLESLIGARTRRIGETIRAEIEARHATAAQSLSAADRLTLSHFIAEAFGKLEAAEKTNGRIQNKTLAFFSPFEEQRLKAFLVETLADAERIKAFLTLAAIPPEETAPAADADAGPEGAQDGPAQDDFSGTVLGATDMFGTPTAAPAAKAKAAEKSRKGGKPAPKPKRDEKAIGRAQGEIRAAVLNAADPGVDVALMGRMFADAHEFDRTAALHVAHAFTTHRAVAEDDFFSGMDDRSGADETGAGHIDTAFFGSGVYYQYLVLNRALLERNLGTGLAAEEKNALLRDTITALIEALPAAVPGGRQASFAAYPPVDFTLVEVGAEQPRSLAGAFAMPVSGEDLLNASIGSLLDYRARLNRIYGNGNAAAMMTTRMPAEIAEAVAARVPFGKADKKAEPCQGKKLPPSISREDLIALALTP
ncbi:type I-E CRISPR-associated protein Cas7/Cse4/CasC [Sabulicella rubraurantiaca]|uniref:type I-E CRISPR-associated protein Cas7/Cse4/CasC n=1 Tax=Sabulicella rubraurantiaca TaxID=2811429 RepID=UPI001A9581D5|nr:type I-E CRISPR-associated protein Cas7/Cse4/CasC [Sabulicella rubraurantiaca]